MYIGTWAQLCHNEADRPDSLHLDEIGLMKRVGVNIILRYLLTGLLYFNCVPNLDL